MPSPNLPRYAASLTQRSIFSFTAPSDCQCAPARIRAYTVSGIGPLCVQDVDRPEISKRKHVNLSNSETRKYWLRYYGKCAVQKSYLKLALKHRKATGSSVSSPGTLS